MRLDRISIRLRRRSAWEALDLGHAMLRAWARPAYLAWAASYWLMGLTLLLVLWPWQQYAIVAVWWLKPVCDRVLLFTFSRSLFGTATGLADLRQGLPGLLKAPGLISGLTLRRFSMARSFLLPVWQLEAQRGKAARARFRLLARRTRGNAVWLTFVCANLVTMLWFAQVVLVEALVPLGQEGLFSWQEWFGNDMPAWKLFISNLLLMVAESLVEPFYVASGFSLYLNRRSELEGWDIELAFRRLAARCAETKVPAPPRATLAVAMLLALSAVLALPEPAQAAEASGPKQVIGEVLADPVFGQQTDTMEWRARPKEGQSAELPDWLRPYLRFIEFAAEVMRGLVWVGALLLAAALLYLLIRYSEGWRLAQRAAAPPDYLFGLDVRPASLPADVAGTARRHLAAGRLDEALSLLYRGALVALIHRLQVEFRAGDTEGDCLHRVEGPLPGPARLYFSQLLEAWRATAYGHEPPPLSRLEALCDSWPQYFGSEQAPT